MKCNGHHYHKRAPKILPARHWQRRDDPTRAIAVAGERKISLSLQSAFKHFRRSVPREAIADTIRRKSIRAAANLVPVDVLRASLKDPFGKIVDVYRQSGTRVADRITRQLRHVRRHRVEKAVGDRFAFDILGDSTAQLLSDYQDQFLESLTTDVRAQVEQIIIDGINAGADASEIAGDISLIVGLSARQAGALVNLRASLEAGDSNALNYALMNTADSELLQEAIDNNTVLDQATIDDIVENYADASLQYRADLIAVTESTRAANLGLSSAYGQAIDNGVFPDTAVRVYWQLDMDERTCDICMSIPDQNPDGIEPGDTFDSDDGPIDFPPVHPNCRCTVDYVTDLDQIET